MADRANGILLDTTVVVAHLRGVIDVFALVAAEQSLLCTAGSLSMSGLLFCGFTSR